MLIFITLIVIAILICVSIKISKNNENKSKTYSSNSLSNCNVHQPKEHKYTFDGLKFDEVTHQASETALGIDDYHKFHNDEINRQHYKNLTTLLDCYKKVTASRNYFGAEAKQLIRICEDDIKIAPDFVKLHKQYNQEIPSYPAFKKLAMVYEKREEFDCAATVCLQAIRLGFIDDGTKGTMYNRLCKMLKLANIDIDVNQYLQDNL